MSEKGLIRACDLVTTASVIEQYGGSVKRVFERSNLPIALLEHGDMPIPVTDMFNFAREACWEVGDGMLGALESTDTSFKDTGVWGKYVLSADTLAGAIFRDCAMQPYYSNRTEAQLRVIGDKAHYSYEFKVAGKEGKQQADLACMGNALEVLRQYLDPDIPSAVVHVPYFSRSEISRLEQIFNVPCLRTHGVSKVVFDASLLVMPAKPELSGMSDFQSPAWFTDALLVPDTVAGAMEAIAGMLLLEDNPRIEDVAKRMGMSTRTAQRVLKGENTSFSTMLEKLKARRAIELMERGRPLSDVSSRLGYSNQAHFSRAFSRWAGMPPGRFMTLSRELQAR